MYNVVKVLKTFAVLKGDNKVAKPSIMAELLNKIKNFLKFQILHVSQGRTLCKIKFPY